MLELFVIGAIAIIVLLSVIAIYYLWKLKKQQETRKEALVLQAKQEYENVKRIKNSIIVIARAIVSDQVSIAEGAVRLSVLLNGIKNFEQKTEYIALYKLSEAISHIPILDGWKKLSREEKQEFEKEIARAEQKYGDFVIDAAKRIISMKLDTVGDSK